MPLEDKNELPINSNIGIEAHICRENGQAAQIELLTYQVVEARLVIRVQAQYIVDLERRMAEMGNHGNLSR